VTRSDIKIFLFDSACKLKSSVAYPDTGAFDPEDVTTDANGTLWIADTGDNPPTAGGSGTRRKSIAVWSLAPGAGQKPVIHRLSYPDPPHDAEAILINGDGLPIIITKEDESTKLGGAAGLYVPTAPLQNNNATGVPMKRAGEIKLPASTTPNPLPIVVRQLITGAATSPDRKRVVLRTYADAYEWDVPDGDVVKAITTGKPRITPLPNESWGEAIAYTQDGASFVTVGDNESATSQAAPILRYTPATAAQTAASKTKDAAAKPASKSWTDTLTLQQLTYVVGVVGVIGLILVVAGVLGIRNSRRQRKAAAGKGGTGKAAAGKGGTGNGAGKGGRDDVTAGARADDDGGYDEADPGSDDRGGDGRGRDRDDGRGGGGRGGGKGGATGTVYGAGSGGATGTVYGAGAGASAGASAGGGGVQSGGRGAGGVQGGGRQRDAAPRRGSGAVYGGPDGSGGSDGSYRGGADAGYQDGRDGDDYPGGRGGASGGRGRRGQERARYDEEADVPQPYTGTGRGYGGGPRGGGPRGGRSSYHHAGDPGGGYGGGYEDGHAGDQYGRDQYTRDGRSSTPGGGWR
jgi:hypothetical protein